MGRITAIIVGGTILALVVLALLVNHYRDNAITYKDQRDVAALDEKYTGELVDAKATIDQLERDVAAGKRRLQLNAKCPKQSATGAASMDDVASPGLTDAAQRDYFTLRERIETSGKMITGLQDYIKEPCLHLY